MDPPVTVAVNPLPVNTQFCELGTTKCHQESELSGAALSGMSWLLHVGLATAVGTCDGLMHSVAVAHVGAEVRLNPFVAGAPSVPKPMKASPAVHSAAPARRTPNVDLSRLGSPSERSIRGE